jgi:hypothetical protein
MVDVARPLFKLGQLCSTPGALEALQTAGQNAAEFLARHVSGDWGIVDSDDQQANNDAINDESRILSAYKLGTGTKIWIITEADRSVTTLLLPEEY